MFYESSFFDSVWTYAHQATPSLRAHFAERKAISVTLRDCFVAENAPRNDADVFCVSQYIDSHTKQGYIARTEARQPYIHHKTAGFVLPLR